MTTVKNVQTGVNYILFISISSSYLAINTSHLVYRNQSFVLNTEIIAVCSEIHTKHINSLSCGQKVEFVHFRTGGTYSDHRVLKCLMCIVVLRGTPSLHVEYGK